MDGAMNSNTLSYPITERAPANAPNHTEPMIAAPPHSEDLSRFIRAHEADLAAEARVEARRRAEIASANIRPAGLD